MAEYISDAEVLQRALDTYGSRVCCADDVHEVRRRKVERLKERLDNGS